MIKFFRKIRQKMLTENKFSKYLIYAIGEIILVMIGILLALQVNNWNTERVQNIESLELSKRLLQETNQNIELLKLEVENQNQGLSSLLHFLKMTGKNYKEKNIEKTDSLLYSVLSSPRFVLNTSVLEEAISTGSLASIKSDSLRNLIYDLPSVFREIRDDIGYIDNHDNFNLIKRFYEIASLRERDGKFSPYAIKLESSNFPNIDNRIILNDMQFESLVDNKSFLISTLLNHYALTQTKLHKISDMLSEEIKNK
jgi:hypothetical protein